LPHPNAIRQQNQRKADDREIAHTGIGWQAAPGGDRRFEHIGGKFRSACDDFAVGTDDSGNAVVRGTDEESLHLRKKT